MSTTRVFKLFWLKTKKQKTKSHVEKPTEERRKKVSCVEALMKMIVAFSVLVEMSIFSLG
jgi:hypothetical protein